MKSKIFTIIKMLGIIFIISNQLNAQSLKWAKIYSTNGIADGAKAIFVISDGTVYSGGSAATTSGQPNNQNMFLAKYNSNGTLIWSVSYDGSGYEDPSTYMDLDAINDIVVDNSGNIYVTGWTWNGKSYYDITTIKYNSSGTQQWVRTYGSSLSWDFGYEIELDSVGNVYVAGMRNEDIALIKYNSSGTQQWATLYNGPGNSTDDPFGLVVKSNYAYITGITYSSSTDFDCVTLKYNISNGNLVWTTPPIYGGSYSDESYDIAVDNSDNVYICGYMNTGTSSASDGLLIKYNSGGSQQWVTTYNYYNRDAFNSLCLDSNNPPNIFVTGYRYPAPQSPDGDYVTLKYNNSGQQQWINTYDGSASESTDEGYIVNVSPNTGKIYVSGVSNESNQLANITTIRYNPSNGSQEWINSYNNVNLIDEFPSNNHCMALHYSACYSNDEIYICGATLVNSGTNDFNFLTLKYGYTGDCLTSQSQRLTNQEDINSNSLENIIKSIIKDNELVNVKISIYNLMGQLIFNTNNVIDFNIKQINIKPGIYIISLSDDSDIYFHKRLFIKTS